VFHVKQSKPVTPDDEDAENAAALRERLDVFTRLLTRWNPTIRLVSQQDMPHLWQRHVEDSLQLIPLIPRETPRAVDLGSGGGFPGLVLAIATGIHFDLIEADGRKAAFLREAAAATEAPVTVHGIRIEEVRLPPVALVTARAMAPLRLLLDLASPFLLPGGTCLFPKGGRAEAEITEAERDWTMTLRRVPSATAPDAQILAIKSIMRREAPEA
jgi:16S rRNA (guanine527-N7)-methyltransferase